MTRENDSDLLPVKRSYKISLKGRSCQVTIPDILVKLWNIDKDEIEKKKTEEHVNYFINKEYGLAIMVHSKDVDIKAPGLETMSLKSPLSLSDFEKIIKGMK